MAERVPSFPLLLATLGRALAMWSAVENNMGLLFNAASDIPDIHKAGAIFDAVIAFEARISVLDAMMESDKSITLAEKELWAALSARLRKLYKKRHEVAHFSIMPEDGEVQFADRIQPFFTWNKEARKANKSLTIAQIEERNGIFNDAANAMSWFVNLMQRRKFPSKYQPPPMPEPVLIARIRESVAQKKAEQTPKPEA